MKQLMTKFMNDESGQDLIEYALIAALIALVAISALTSVGSKVSGVLAASRPACKPMQPWWWLDLRGRLSAGRWHCANSKGSGR